MPISFSFPVERNINEEECLPLSSSLVCQFLSVFRVERNINEEECLPLASGLKGRTSLSFKFEMAFKKTGNIEKSSKMAGNFLVTSEMS